MGSMSSRKGTAAGSKLASVLHLRPPIGSLVLTSIVLLHLLLVFIILFHVVLCVFSPARLISWSLMVFDLILEKITNKNNVT